MKTKIRNYVTIALFFAFSSVTTVAFASDGEKEAPKAELKYIGNMQNQPMFQLHLNSVNEEEFTVTIKDEFGEVLYTEKLTTKYFVRTFRLDTESVDATVLRVEVRSGNNKKPEVFTINRNSRFVDETSVSKL